MDHTSLGNGSHNHVLYVFELVVHDRRKEDLYDHYLCYLDYILLVFIGYSCGCMGYHDAQA